MLLHCLDRCSAARRGIYTVYMASSMLLYIRRRKLQLRYGFARLGNEVPANCSESVDSDAVEGYDGTSLLG